MPCLGDIGWRRIFLAFSSISSPSCESVLATKITVSLWLEAWSLLFCSPILCSQQFKIFQASSVTINWYIFFPNLFLSFVLNRRTVLLLRFYSGSKKSCYNRVKENIHTQKLTRQHSVNWHLQRWSESKMECIFSDILTTSWKDQ